MRVSEVIGTYLHYRILARLEGSPQPGASRCTSKTLQFHSRLCLHRRSDSRKQIAAKRTGHGLRFTHAIAAHQVTLTRGFGLDCIMLFSWPKVMESGISFSSIAAAPCKDLGNSIASKVDMRYCLRKSSRLDYCIDEQREQ